MSKCLLLGGGSSKCLSLLQAIEQVPQEQKESVTRTAKMRTLGNIRLIAELFKKSVVPEKIVHMCIQDLTGDAKHEPSENNVEVNSMDLIFLAHAARTCGSTFAGRIASKLTSHAKCKFILKSCCRMV